MVISELVGHQARIWTTLECAVCWYKKSAQLLLTWVVSVHWLSVEGVALSHFMIVTFLHFFLLVYYSRLDTWRIFGLQCVLWLPFGFFSSLKDSALPTSNKIFPATFRAFLQIVGWSPMHSAWQVAFGVVVSGETYIWGGKGTGGKQGFSHLKMPEHAESTKGQGVIRILVLNQGVAIEFTN